MSDLARELPASALGVLIGVVASAVLYAVIVGLFAALSGGGDAIASPLWQRALQFGITFGLIAGGHLGLAGGRRANNGQRPSVSLKVILIAVVFLAIILAATGGWWNAMIEGVSGGALLLLIAAWMVAIYFLERVIGKAA